ncbi:FkbM family methyltransferase [Desulfurococcus amylolyticus]|uniref:FkbM family methyltransferase n=1 Tax=Desulfurococcus amylolyticus TaxID=94694 RepID=UPI0022772C5B|nr:FkbM family methyltransferase [Desulfurococcus amylolyticus]
MGAHQRSFTVESIIKASPGQLIIAVELNPIAVKLCLDNIKALGNIIKAKNPRIKTAVWDLEGEIYLDMSYWSEGAHVSTSGRGLRVRAVTMDDILNLAEGRTIVKMDIEGSEYRVLSKAELENVDIIPLEVHGSTEQIVKTLRDKGFKTQITTQPISKELALTWLKIKPRSMELS